MTDITFDTQVLADALVEVLRECDTTALLATLSSKQENELDSRMPDECVAAWALCVIETAAFRGLDIQL